MSNNWSEDELQASVDAYIAMHRLETSGKFFTKKTYYEALANRFGRTVKAYEYRMQNISYVYSLQGRQWVFGLKPARNVGTNVIQKLENLIARSERQELGNTTVLDVEIEKLSKNPPLSPPKGKKIPASVQTSITQFVRDPAVVAWVLNNASGHCECCDAPAPFIRENGQPFLEVHHVRGLADGGEDTTMNAVALCPNCHRELHYGAEKRKLAEKLRAKISRLQVEVT